MDSQKMVQNFNYDAEIGDLRDQIRKLKSENRHQSARIRELEEALEFYAKGENWRSPSKGFALQYDPVPSAISKDSGHIAKQALNKTEQSDGSVSRIKELEDEREHHLSLIRELEGLLDRTVSLLLKMPDEINDFELIEEAENVLSTSETGARYGEVGSQLALQFQPDD